MTRTTRKSQGGFTLLEMLVTVGIMAAVAGTATVALQDTTARASAAAHVAMMDELNEGVRTFRTLRGNQYPNNFDSLLGMETGVTDITAAVLLTDLVVDNLDNSILGIEDVVAVAMPDGVLGILNDIGMSQLQYVSVDSNPADDGDCKDIQALINSRGNAVVAGNIFMSENGNGCGVPGVLHDGTDGGETTGAMGAFWTGGTERLTGQPAAAGIVELATPSGVSNLATATGPAYLAVGFGPASTLFDASTLGGLTSVPVYRHVAKDQYNRFIGLFYVGDFAGGTIVPAGQVAMVTVVDGAGDTKEEELGEWDGTRNTI